MGVKNVDSAAGRTGALSGKRLMRGYDWWGGGGWWFFTDGFYEFGKRVRFVARGTVTRVVRVFIVFFFFIITISSRRTKQKRAARVVCDFRPKYIKRPRGRLYVRTAQTNVMVNNLSRRKEIALLCNHGSLWQPSK